MQLCCYAELLEDLCPDVTISPIATLALGGAGPLESLRPVDLPAYAAAERNSERVRRFLSTLWMVRGRGRGAAAAATWIFRGDAASARP